VARGDPESDLPALNNFHRSVDCPEETDEPRGGELQPE
jgi:hypothetical protein